MRHLITYKQLIDWGYKKLCIPAILGNLEVYPDLKMELIKCCDVNKTVGELIIPGNSTKKYRNEMWKVFKGCTPSLDIMKKFREMYVPIVVFRQDYDVNVLSVYLSEGGIESEQIFFNTKDMIKNLGLINHFYCTGEWKNEMRQYIPGEMRTSADDSYFHSNAFFQYINVRQVNELDHESTMISYC